MLDSGCEAWTVRKRDETRITAAEMQFMRHAGVVQNGTTNEMKWWNKSRQKQFKIHNKQRWNWRDHVNRIDRRKIPKHIVQYMPRYRRSIGHLAIRWLKIITDHVIQHMFGRRWWKNKMNYGSVCKVIIMCCISYLEPSETRKCLMYCIWKLSAPSYGLHFAVLFHMLLCIIFKCG